MTRGTQSVVIGAVFLGLVAVIILRRGAAEHEGLSAPPIRPVRNAGPADMRDPPHEWSQEDELSDESFPASDPPGTY